MTLLSVENPTLGFDTDEGRITAVDNVLFELAPGEVMGLVDESDSGKTTLGCALLKAAPITRGSIRFDDSDVCYELAEMGKAELKERPAHLSSPIRRTEPAPSLYQSTPVSHPLARPGPSQQGTETDWGDLKSGQPAARLQVSHLLSLSGRDLQDRRIAPGANPRRPHGHVPPLEGTALRELSVRKRRKPCLHVERRTGLRTDLVVTDDFCRRPNEL